MLAAGGWQNHSYAGSSGKVWLYSVDDAAANVTLLTAFEDATDAVTSVAWSPGGLLAVVCSDKKVRLYSVDGAGGNAALLATLFDVGQSVGSVAWSPAGGLLTT